MELFNLIKDIYKKIQLISYLMVKKMNVFSLIQRIRQVYALLLLLVNIILEVLVRKTRQEK